MKTKEISLIMNSLLWAEKKIKEAKNKTTCCKTDLLYKLKQMPKTFIGTKDV